MKSFTSNNNYSQHLAGVFVQYKPSNISMAFEDIPSAPAIGSIFDGMRTFPKVSVLD